MFIITSLTILHGSNRLSATFDEPFYLEAGLISWRTGSNKVLMKAGTMPLPVDVVMLPLYLMERHRDRPFATGTDIAEMIGPARSCNLIFWFVLLTYTLRLGALLGGPWAGRIALLLVATEPNLLAHAGLATTDIAVSAGILVATFYFLKGRSRGRFWRVVVPGIAYGFALLCKASALAFVPLIWAAIELRELWLEGNLNFFTKPGRTAAFRLWLDFAGQFSIALIVTFAYCGSDWKTERTFVEWAHSLPEGGVKSTMVPISEHLKIFTNAGEALAQQIKHNFRGHGSYVLGQWYGHSVWYYFPVALAAKLTIPSLTVILCGLVLQPRKYFGPLGWATLALLLFSLNCRVQIGIRLVFPLVVFLLISAAFALSPASLRDRGPSRVRMIFLALAILCQSILLALAGPDRIRYFNPLFGGESHGYVVLSDSNADWGQGLKELAEWNQKRQPSDANVEPIAVWYYGMDPRSRTLPFRNVALHSMPPKSTTDDFIKAIGGNDIAVSTSILFSDPNISPSGKTAIEWLKSKTPREKVGPFLIYNVR
ncbi:MAG: hypothetical protein U0798_20035 [Gemmataceae bacterium]